MLLDNYVSWLAQPNIKLILALNIDEPGKKYTSAVQLKREAELDSFLWHYYKYIDLNSI
jgi:hypothetical protein